MSDSDDAFCLTMPEARSRIPRPASATPAGRDPFRIVGPAVVSFSGGRTSGYLLRRVLDAFDGVLPSDVHVVFANTGEEDTRTLDFVHRCATEWGVRIVWVEYHDECDGRWREVDYHTASRGGEPFARMLDRKGALPNGRMRFCTQELKLFPMRGYMRSLGYRDDEWSNVVGLRWDEPGRVATLRARDSTWDVLCPLYDSRVSKQDVRAWWSANNFDLETPAYAGNCVGCFLKGRTLRDRAAREAPEVWERWAHHEAVAGARFVHAEPEGYAGQLRRVRALPVLPAFDESADDGTLPCDCTQRRAPPIRTCTCGARRGKGHALLCSQVWGDAPGIYYAPAPSTDDAARVTTTGATYLGGER